MSEYQKAADAHLAHFLIKRHTNSELAAIIGAVSVVVVVATIFFILPSSPKAEVCHDDWLCRQRAAEELQRHGYTVVLPQHKRVDTADAIKVDMATAKGLVVLCWKCDGTGLCFLGTESREIFYLCNQCDAGQKLWDLRIGSKP